jgi:hypothetical protein
MTTDWGGWTLYTAKAKYWFSNTWDFVLNERLKKIDFEKIRWNYISPNWKELPIIYKFFNQEEWKNLLSENHYVNNSILLDSTTHYLNSIDFSNAFNIWEKNTTWVNVLNFRNAIIADNVNLLWWWTNWTSTSSNLWTGWFYSKNNVTNLFWFPDGGTYWGTYRIWTETFVRTSAFSNLGSISVFIK